MRHLVGIVGYRGYSGAELVSILRAHPHVRPVLMEHRAAGDGGGDSGIRAGGAKALHEIPATPDAVRAEKIEIVCLATPAEVSMQLAPQMLDAGARVIDLSGAFRFRGAETFTSWYQLPAPHAEWLGEAVYGLPELYSKEIAAARLVANPGCYSTSVILALRPLTESGWIARNTSVVCDCKSGASGAGKDPRRDLHFVEVDENFKAYGLFTHRHTPEILEHTGLSESQVVFSTHLLPLARGILSTIYVTLDPPRSGADVEALFRKFYAGRPMVRIWRAGALPELQHVAHTNFCDIGFALDSSGRRLVLISCLDNLGKGAAGQAVQNLNHMLGIEEQTSLQ